MKKLWCGLNCTFIDPSSETYRTRSCDFAYITEDCQEFMKDYMIIFPANILRCTGNIVWYLTSVSCRCSREASEGEYVWIKSDSFVFYYSVTVHPLWNDEQCNDIMSDESEQLLALRWTVHGELKRSSRLLVLKFVPLEFVSCAGEMGSSTSSRHESARWIVYLW